MKLVQYKKYQADVVLEGLEAWSPNEIIVQKLISAGFSNVQVTGTSTKRTATGVWSKPTQEADASIIPKQIKNIKKL